MFKNALFTAAIGGLLAAPAQAAIVTHTGDTTFAPTYNRSLEDLTGLSNTGTAVRYDNYTFTVSRNGNYTFATTGNFDTFATLYSPTFDATQGRTYAKIAQDDLLSTTTSGFAYMLQEGLSYSYITTGFSNSDFGMFSTTIGGDGAITPDTAEGPAVTGPGIFTRTGDTTDGPIFDRPLEDLTGLSAAGDGVAYDSFVFRVSATGDYTFLTTGAFDTFDFLYAPTLDPTSPLTNSAMANDDLLGLSQSGFVYRLLKDVDYTLVTTGFTPMDRGFFSSTIGGPGSIVTAVAAVPEPGVVALIFTGLAAMSMLARRRKPQADAPDLAPNFATV